MTTLPNTGVTLPIRGAPGSGHWADVLDTNWMNYDGHDHQSGRGLPIRSAALTIDGNVSFNTTWAITALNRTTFASVAPPAVNKSVWVADGTGGTTANELYWTTNTGANVKLTSGTTLNVGAFVGGIGGDYTSVGAQLNYDDAGKRYTLKEGTGDANGWARVACGGMRLLEFNTTETVYVEQLAPAALAGTYSMTWPTALPASGQTVSVDNTGQIAFGSSQALAANNSYTVSGTGDYKHGTRTLPVTAAMFTMFGGVTNGLGLGGVTFGITTGTAVLAPISLPDGARVLAVRVYIIDNATGPSTLVATFYSVGTTGTVTDIASSSASAGSGANQTLTIGSLTTTFAASKSYGIKVAVTSASGSTCTVYMAEVDYDRP